MQKYPTRFYGRTWVFWAGILFLIPFAVLCLVMGLLAILGNEQVSDPEAWGGFIIAGLFISLLACACCFQVFARQTPILGIYQEGIIIRTIGSPVLVNNLILRILCAFGLFIIILPLIGLWKCITLQAFRIRTVRLRWEKVVTILPDEKSLTIAGWFEKDHDGGFELDAAPEFYHAVSYDTDSFGISIGKVIEAVVFNAFNPDSREMLPSWHDTEAMLGNDTFDFQRS